MLYVGCGLGWVGGSHVEGDAFWTAVSSFVSSSLISMAQMTLLPLQLVPMYLPAKSLQAGSNQFQLTIAIGSKQNGQKGLGFNTLTYVSYGVVVWWCGGVVCGGVTNCMTDCLVLCRRV